MFWLNFPGFSWHSGEMTTDCSGFVRVLDKPFASPSCSQGSDPPCPAPSRYNSLLGLWGFLKGLQSASPWVAQFILAPFQIPRIARGWNRWPFWSLPTLGLWFYGEGSSAELAELVYCPCNKCIFDPQTREELILFTSTVIQFKYFFLPLSAWE